MMNANDLRNLAEELEKKDKAIESLMDDIKELKTALHILLNAKTEDRQPEGIRLKVADFLTVYNAMFRNGGNQYNGYREAEGPDLMENHIYGHDITVSWHGLWCNCEDGASACNHIIGGLEGLADEIED